MLNKQRSREMAAALRKDPRYTDESNVEHKQAVEMELLYSGQFMAEDGAPIIGDE